LLDYQKKYKAFPDELSGGEQQRIALARAIINNPSILIADEPTGNLDPDTSLEIMDIINDINQAGTTVLMATHARDIVDDMRKRVIALDKGIVVRDEQRGAYGDED
jgi:cell division transport system ATP-binding protein